MNPDHPKYPFDPDSSFFIGNVVTGELTVQAPNAEQIEKVFGYTDTWTPKRGIEQVIVEIPRSYGVTLSNYRQFPRNMIFDGVARFAQRKANEK